MKKFIILIQILSMAACIFAGCSVTPPTAPETYTGTPITLSDSGITVDGQPASTDASQAVYTANDIIYYEEGHDFTYGEGSKDDSHSKEDAAAHTVVHITQPGQYILSGNLSKGQIAVDLGKDADEDPDAVVTLVLDGVNITCEVAPAIIFYHVYECGTADTETATKTVDTAKAGANIVLADGSENTVTGSYVARIYKPDSVVLSDDGSEVADAKKLHKYDGAVYSKMSMNVRGGSLGNGTLNIHAANEGLDTELHLTINSGNINIISGNDGINTNEDSVSVTTINGGNLNILVNGATGEGDGIDSNGWLVINGGSVTAQACAFSGDAGIDSDMGIHINGGRVFATGNMLDRISESAQNYAVFQFPRSQSADTYALKNADGQIILEQPVTNSFSYLIISDPALTPGDYTLWQGETQLQGMLSGGMGGGQNRPGELPEGMEPPEGAERPEGMEPPESTERPEGMEPPEGMERPEGTKPPEGAERPEGMEPPTGGRPNGGQQQGITGTYSGIFSIREGGNYFVSVSEMPER